MSRAWKAGDACLSCDTLERAEEVFANGVARAERRIAGEVA